MRVSYYVCLAVYYSVLRKESIWNYSLILTIQQQPSLLMIQSVNTTWYTHIDSDELQDKCWRPQRFSRTTAISAAVAGKQCRT